MSEPLGDKSLIRCRAWFEGRMSDTHSFKQRNLMRTCARFAAVSALVLLATLAVAQSELAPGSPQLVTPEDLLKIIQAPQGEKPLILDIGPAYLYMQAHIPGAEYVGAASTPQGMQALRTRVKSVPRNAFIVLYCGCCPWSHCPNVRPALNELQKRGFSNVKVLYIADNFGANWVDKGYPTIGSQ